MGALSVLMFLLTGRASAETSKPGPAVLWYRSTEGCPDGSSFMTRMGERSSQVRLAQAGDHVDFVVTLNASSDGAHGRLERETERGTVAIREMDDPSCERVADVVALNLSLALDPGGAAGETEGEPSPAPTEEASPKQVRPMPTSVSPPVPSSTETSKAKEENGTAMASAVPLPAEANEEPSTARDVSVRAGVQLGFVAFVFPAVLGRGAVFGELGGIGRSWLPELTLRLAAFGAFGVAETELGTVQQALWGGRVEVCPIGLRMRRLALRPCAAFELGQLLAVRAFRDSALWSAVALGTRGAWAVAGPISLEAELGALLPLARYEVTAGSTRLYHSSVLGMSAGFGVSLDFK